MDKNDDPGVVNTYHIRWDELEVDDRWLDGAVDELHRELETKILRDLIYQHPRPETRKRER
tara:strand:- start:82 stop:264 length:183 start_codon:yes stop_codon:yes gene_type:complete